MSSAEYLREFVSERLTAAAEEIFGAFKKTIVEYEEEIHRQRRLLDVFCKPDIKLQRIDLPQQHVYKEKEVVTEQQLYIQERNSSLDQDEPQPLQIKEEQEELCTSQEGEQPVLKQDTDSSMWTPTYEESDHHEDQTLDFNIVETESVEEDEPLNHISAESSLVPEPNSDHQLLSRISQSQDQRGQQTQHHKNSHTNTVSNLKMSRSHSSTHTGAAASTYLAPPAQQNMPYVQPFQGAVAPTYSAPPPQTYNYMPMPMSQPAGIMGQGLTPVGMLNGEPLFLISQGVSTTLHPAAPPPSTSKSKKKKRDNRQDDGPYIKKPPNAFMLYMKEQRQNVVLWSNKRGSAEVNTILAERWKALPKAEQEKYYKKAAILKCLHEQQHPDWSTKDNYGKKRRKSRSKAPQVFGDLPQLHVYKQKDVVTEQQLYIQERNSSLDQDEPEIIQIKEEEEELCTSQEGEQPVLKQDTDSSMWTPTYEESDHREDETLNFNIIETESGGEEEPHTSKKSFKCDLCHRAFTWKSNLQRHRASHTVDKPHSCSTCGKSFNQKSQLIAHVRIHLGQFICKICWEDFQTRDRLIAHMGTHTGEKP